MGPGSPGGQDHCRAAAADAAVDGGVHGFQIDQMGKAELAVAERLHQAPRPGAAAEAAALGGQRLPLGAGFRHRRIQGFGRADVGAGPAHAFLEFPPRVLPRYWGVIAPLHVGEKLADGRLRRPPRRLPIQGRLGIGVGDAVGGAQAGHLARIQRRAAGPVDPVRTVDLADGEQAPDVGRFPPVVGRQPAVVVLGADGDFQGLGADVDAVVQVQLDGLGVHGGEALDGRALQGLGVFEVGMGLLAQAVEGEAGRVCPVVQEHPAPFHYGFDIDQDVDQGRAADDLARIEGPLVALEEDHGIPLARRLEVGIEEFLLVVAVPVGAYEARHHLHERARHVPAELDGGHAVLRLRQALGAGAGQERQTDAAGVHLGVHAGPVDPARAAGGEHHVLGAVGFQVPGVVDGDGAGGALAAAAPDGQQRHHVAFLADFDVAALGLADQRPAHLARRIGADGGGALARVVIGLVADELAHGVLGKGHPHGYQVEEGPGRQAGLDQSQIAMHGAAGEVGVGHEAGRIGIGAAQREFVIGLLVTAGVDGGAHFEALGEDEDVLDALLVQLDGGVEPGGAAADDQGVDELHGDGGFLATVLDFDSLQHLSAALGHGSTPTCSMDMSPPILLQAYVVVSPFYVNDGDRPEDDVSFGLGQSREGKTIAVGEQEPAGDRKNKKKRWEKYANDKQYDPFRDLQQVVFVKAIK